MQLSPLDYFF
jgi:hypothetical protein